MTLRIILLLILLVLPLIPTFWALIDIPRRRFSSTKKKVLWFLVVSTFPFVGAIVYITIARRGTEPIKP